MNTLPTRPRATVSAIAYHLPELRIGNQQLAAEFPEWNAEKIATKTGIDFRHIAAAEELSSDLAYAAALKLFSSGACDRKEIDFLLLCTQTPDYLLPTTACLLQHRLGLGTGCGALDFNLGCSGFVYGLSLAKGLIETGQARNVLLITAETYSKLLNPADKTVRTLFGDGAAATLIQEETSEEEFVGPFVFGTDGSGGPNLICSQGGFRGGANTDLFMNGPEIFNFTLKAVPAAVNDLLRLSDMSMAQVDLFVFHQANSYMLEQLRRKIGIPADKFVVTLKDSGNTVSATIPIALYTAIEEGKLRRGMKVMLVGFGVGYSWAAAMLRW